jgi:hypothetical protein
MVKPEKADDHDAINLQKCWQDFHNAPKQLIHNTPKDKQILQSSVSQLRLKAKPQTTIQTHSTSQRTCLSCCQCHPWQTRSRFLHCVVIQLAGPQRPQDLCVTAGSYTELWTVQRSPRRHYCPMLQSQCSARFCTLMLDLPWEDQVMSWRWLPTPPSGSHAVGGSN